MAIFVLITTNDTTDYFLPPCACAWDQTVGMHLLHTVDMFLWLDSIDMSPGSIAQTIDTTQLYVKNKYHPRNNYRN